MVPGKVQLRSLPDDPDIRYFVYVPKSLDGTGRVLVAVHGISRNAREIAVTFSRYAENYSVILVVPWFDKDRFPDYQRLGRVGRGGRADHALGKMLEDVGTARTETFYLYGNSGGGQFAHRYVMAYPERVRRFVVSATGWYTPPDLARKYPYGLKPKRNLPGVTFDIDRFLRVPACVLVGENDTLRDDSLNQSEFLDSTEGKNRVERAKWWIGALTTAARWRGIKTRYELHFLPLSGHDFTEMEERGELGTVVFRCLFDNH